MRRPIDISWLVFYDFFYIYFLTGDRPFCLIPAYKPRPCLSFFLFAGVKGARVLLAGCQTFSTADDVDAGGQRAKKENPHVKENPQQWTVNL